MKKDFLKNEKNPETKEISFEISTKGVVETSQFDNSLIAGGSSSCTCSSCGVVK